MRVFDIKNFRTYILRTALFTVALLSLVLCSIYASYAADYAKNKILIGKKEKMTTADPVVVMDTTKGTIRIQIYKNEAPITANNFLDLVNRGFYNGLTFHRYEPGFCVQGGDPKGDGTGGFIDPQTQKERRIPLEVKPNLRHDSKGVIAMARATDPNSASSQFYFTLGSASFLDMQYAVFGKVIDGLSVVEQLRKGDKMTKVSVLEPAAK